MDKNKCLNGWAFRWAEKQAQKGNMSVQMRAFCIMLVEIYSIYTKIRLSLKIARLERKVYKIEKRQAKLAKRDEKLKEKKQKQKVSRIMSNASLRQMWICKKIGCYLPGATGHLLLWPYIYRFVRPLDSPLGISGFASLNVSILCMPFWY